MDDKDLLAAAEAEPAPLESGSEYLQESGDTVAQMTNKFKTVQPKEASDLKPTELAEIEAKKKFDFLNQEVGAMVKRGDVGHPVLDTRTNEPLQGDMEFLGEKKTIPEDLKKEM